MTDVSQSVLTSSTVSGRAVFYDETEPSDQTEALTGLVAAARDLSLAVALADLPAARLQTLTEQLAALTQEIGANPRRRTVRLSAPSHPQVSSFLASSGDPVTGTLNPIAIPMHLALTPAGEVRSELTVDARFEGPPDSVHGGYAAMLMDALLGQLIRGHGLKVVTGTLSLRYLRKTPLDQPLTLTARIVSQSGRKIQAAGDISAGGQITVEATGLFIRPAEN